ncbi:MAG: diaminopimelate epimerase [Nitrospirae bacterium]|nr:diaminopimelate epimerase [Nitrospirota bacterium]
MFEPRTSGNDFILIDNRRGALKEFKGRKLNRFAAAVCTHRMSVGGDGLILIERPTNPRQAHFRWRLFNADGTEAELSGNGGRCAARFAYLKKIAPAKMVFETLAGPIRAEIKGAHVKIQMPTPQSLQLDIKVPVRDATYVGHFLNTGVPHTVLFVDDPAAVDVVPLGRAIRYHEIKNPRLIQMRTYERGVEDETLACGTGAVATALISAALGQVRSPVTLIQRSGMTLKVHYRWDGAQFHDVFLEGDARVVYAGEMRDETLFT